MAKRKQCRSFLVILRYPDWLQVSGNDTYASNVVGYGNSLSDQTVSALEKCRARAIAAQDDGSGIDMDPKEFTLLFAISFIDGGIRIVADADDFKDL